MRDRVALPSSSKDAGRIRYEPCVKLPALMQTAEGVCAAFPGIGNPREERVAGVRVLVQNEILGVSSGRRDPRGMYLPALRDRCHRERPVSLWLWRKVSRLVYSLLNL